MVETLISIVINVVISALFAMLVFGGARQIYLWGVHGLALDFVPQTFMITAMSVLVPTLLTRKRIRSGKLPARAVAARVWGPHNVWFRAALIAACATVILGGIATGLLWQWGRWPLAYAQVLPLKLAYGAVVAVLVTPLALSVALSEGSRLGPASKL